MAKAKSRTAENPGAEVNDLYQSAMANLQATVEAVDASPAQKKTARAALEDLFLLHGAHVIQTIDGRTALLSSLILELEGVISRIKVKPFGNALARLTGVVDKARALYDEHKGVLKVG
jgi:hypothetical protein